MSVKSCPSQRKRHIALLQHDRSRRLSLSTLAGILTKLAKHVALIACLMILGKASARSDLGEVAIFLIVLASVALHSCAKAIQRRLAINVFGNKNPP
jgi:uncharacterized membrane protein